MIGIVLFISEGGFSEYLPTLVYIGIAMTFLNIDFAEWRKK